jgi:2-keto-3-deoxy-L-rhamnonate aldolase RhmA
MINTVEDARRSRAFTKFPPLGERAGARLRPDADRTEAGRRI